MIILHGLFGQSDNWNTLAKQFAELGIEVYTVDLRNHGLSPQSEEWDYKAMAQDILELVLENNLSDIILLGHSMGGRVAMEYAFINPVSLRALIVVDMAPKGYLLNNDKVIQGLLSVNLSKIKNRKEAGEALSQYIPDEATKQFLLKNLYWKDDSNLDWRFNLKVLAEQREKAGVAFDAERADSPVPTWFIRGALSNYIVDSDWPTISHIFPKAVLITIPHAGHWVHAEQPKLFFESVKLILEELH